MKYKSLLMTAVIASIINPGCSKKNSYSQENEIMPVDVALPVVDSVIISNNYPGYLVADNAIDIVARVNGIVESKQFKDGQLVKKGQVLFTIEDSQYRDDLKKAEAALATAISTNEYNTNRYNAMKKALESDAVSQIDVVQAESAMKESTASIESCRAALTTAKTTLGYCTVRATSDGHIRAPKVSVGDYVSGGVSPQVLTTIYDDNYCSAQFSVDENHYIKMKDDNANGKIDFTAIPISFTDTLPHQYTGYLSYVAPNVDTSTGTVTLKVKIHNPYGELKEGMYVVVNMPSQSDPKALLVKDSALSTDQLGKYLYTVNDSNRIVYSPVEVGDLIDDTMRIIKSGITPDSRYVTKALLKVRSGMEVKPQLNK